MYGVAKRRVCHIEKKMEQLFSLIVWTIILAVGYFIGSRETKRDVQEKIDELTTPQIPTGVVQRLSEEQMAEKHNKDKRGNLEAFNEFFKKFPIPGKGTWKKEK